jgi:predicted kinase
VCPTPYSPLATPLCTTRSKGHVILLVGLPGAGKTTYLKRRGLNALSSDATRLLLLDDETDQSQQPRVFSALRYLLTTRLRIGRKRTYIDATNLTPWERRPYIKLAQRYGYETQAIFFNVPLEFCERRNRRRKRNVPDDVMERMARRLVPPTREEGFTRITVVRS